ncbi:MAG: hypothetical protein MZU91_12295 [Desulfosudis oleivorans]|nr:hypothetical protein [Desulfosudis oleivorans]
MSTNIKDRIALPPKDAREDQHDLPLLHRGLRLPRVQVGRQPRRRPRRRARTRWAWTSRAQVPPLAADDDPGDDQHRSPTQAGKRWNIMIVPDKECVVNSGLSSTRGGKMASLHVRARRHRPRAAEEPAHLPRRPVARHRLGQRAGALRRADQEDPRHRRPERHRSSTASTTAAPAAASRTPGAPAS